MRLVMCVRLRKHVNRPSGAARIEQSGLFPSSDAAERENAHPICRMLWRPYTSELLITCSAWLPIAYFQSSMRQRAVTQESLRALPLCGSRAANYRAASLHTLRTRFYLCVTSHLSVLNDQSCNGTTAEEELHVELNSADSPNGTATGRTRDRLRQKARDYFA